MKSCVFKFSAFQHARGGAKKRIRGERLDRARGSREGAGQAWPAGSPRPSQAGVPPPRRRRLTGGRARVRGRPRGQTSLLTAGGRRKGDPWTREGLKQRRRETQNPAFNNTSLAVHSRLPERRRAAVTSAPRPLGLGASRAL